MNKIDIGGMSFGVLMAFSAWVRFFTLPSDLGETFLTGMIGAVIFAIFILHHNQTKLANTLYDVEEYLADLNEDEDDENLER